MRVRTTCTLVTLGAVAGTAAPAASQELATKEAPEFRLTDTYGDKVRLSDYRGKVVVLHFFAKWCGSCKLDLEYFQIAHQRYAAEGVVILGLAYASGPRTTVAEFTQSVGVTFPVLMANYDVLQAYNVATFPTNVIVDREGNLRQVAQRLMDHRYWDRIIREIVGDQ